MHNLKNTRNRKKMRTENKMTILVFGNVTQMTTAVHTQTHTHTRTLLLHFTPLGIIRADVQIISCHRMTIDAEKMKNKQCDSQSMVMMNHMLFSASL